MNSADVIVVGAGLAGLVVATELADAGHQVLVLDQEGEQSLGAQAFWSLGGLFMVDTPEQRRMGIRDSQELALADWLGSAGFDRAEDHWPRRWAEAYVAFACGPMRNWLHGLGMRWFPVVGWAERGGSLAGGHGNSVPRFHITWGTGPGVLEPFIRRLQVQLQAGQLRMGYRHRVDRLEKTAGRISGVSGVLLADDPVARGQSSNREVIGEFELQAEHVVVSSGGIGGNLDLVREYWPSETLGAAPEHMICGVPAHVDGRLHGIARQAGASLINTDRMWHYTEGVRNWNPIWPQHGIRILPGPSSMWFDATGQRLPAPCLPGFDTRATLRRILASDRPWSWFVLTQKIIEKEFALSGSEQNPDLSSGSWREVIRSRLGKGATDAVEAFKQHGEDFVVASTLEELVAGMNRCAGNDLIRLEPLREQILARDGQMDNGFAKDAQIMAIHAARKYRGDRLVRVARPHRLLDPAMGPLIAVRLHVLTRKSLGGIHTDLQGRVLDDAGEPMQGLYAAGEVAGFGGGGYHGYNALEGTFLGGCLFSGRCVAQAIAAGG